MILAYDAPGSVRHVLDAAGSPLLAQTFDPYGTIYDSVEALQEDLDEWLVHYNTERPHQGYRDMGRRPIETVESVLQPVRGEA